MAISPIKAFLTEYAINKLASRSNFRYGKQIAENGEVTFPKRNMFNITAEVKLRDKETQTVTFVSSSKGFRYKCSCTNKKDFFCEHCVAAGIIATL